ncbi:GGDEF domain-containing protein [Planctomycetota bacterium]
MEHILRILLAVAIITLILFSFVFQLFIADEGDDPVNRGITWVFFLSLGVGLVYNIVDIYNKRTATKLRDIRIYYNQLKSKMETEVAYSEVFARINELTEVFSNTHDLAAVLNEAVKTLQAVLNVNIITLQLYSDEEDRFFLRIEEGGTDITLGEEIKTDVIELGRSRLINELDAFKDYPELKAEGFQSLIVAPLTKVKPETGKVSIGLVAALTKERRDFTSLDLSLLTAFSRHASLIIQNAQLYMKTQELAIRDGLTNLYNHRHFRGELQTILAKADQDSKALSLVICDIDNFKNYNDTHGHPQGDVVLREISEVLLDNTRGSDIVARYGGEEFVVILPDTTKEGASQVCNIIRNKIHAHDFPDDETQPQGQITVTFGVASYPSEANDAKALINLADQRLYKGKNSGKDKIVS